MADTATNTNTQVTLRELKAKSPKQLVEYAETLEVEAAQAMRTQDLLFSILRELADRDIEIIGTGVLEVLPDGFGFLRSPESNYLPGPDDIYVNPKLLKKTGLRTGDTIEGPLKSPKDEERYFALDDVSSINFESPEKAKEKVHFDNLTPLYPEERLIMESQDPTKKDRSGRVIDIVAPIGKGQRALIVAPLAPPRTGKTVLLQNIASSIEENHPECYLIVLLIDERPEEVTDMRRTVKGEVVASTFDEPATRHVSVAEMVIEKAKRLSEHGRDVVILLDSITRLGRAYNTTVPSSGKVLTGDTGSRMDEVIFEEFKGTGNSEVVLDRKIADKRTFPAIDIMKSGTRKEELITPKEHLQKIYVLRRILNPMGTTDAVDFLLDRLSKTKTNDEFFELMNKGN